MINNDNKNEGLKSINIFVDDCTTIIHIRKGFLFDISATPPPSKSIGYGPATPWIPYAKNHCIHFQGNTQIFDALNAELISDFCMHTYSYRYTYYRKKNKLELTGL